MKLSFHGAAQGVTGSCHLLQAGGLRILIDCGMFQGARHADEENAGDFGFEPSEIDFLLLTHAHLDHCGRIPLLVKRGFAGTIITTAATRELSKLIMMDSAHIQEEDAARASRHNRRGGKDDIRPLYDQIDVLFALDFFGRNVSYDEDVALNDAVKIRFINAGHILGSASVVVEATENEATRRIVFSGDLGSPNHAILSNSTPPPECDYVVMETTYGGRMHKDREASNAELNEVIANTIARGGNVVIPTFAMERTQELLFHLKNAIDSKNLPGSLAIFLDSPMAISATEIFKRHANGFSPEVRDAMLSGKNPFHPRGLRFTRQVEESKAINRIRGGAVIMAGSGMCTGGRVRQHLKHNIWRPDCSIVFVGFAAEGTLARQIVDGAKHIKISGEDIQVKADIHTINGFSAHADQRELLYWVSHTGRPKTVFLVHGDFDRGMSEMKAELEKKGLTVECPTLHSAVELE
ncbi:MBL fold metallo-hydrolase RNA specificity domain-containing protein [Sulfitobacter sp. CW3]|uniref:MBL fold metallo-hydrolase RNA specificity domain-containing protein n=1 Tax=Sulfitobacter sp. CW3 TaxID=2861965 RepID=UPI001C5E216E|nr:MBL fold metallo-hydrolase [Sulfitobacter sp. CW3]MBW4963573.1 MBL fold metallo-hydrolase [Sulfitobacter sp. CW3]